MGEKVTTALLSRDRTKPGEAQRIAVPAIMVTSCAEYGYPILQLVASPWEPHIWMTLDDLLSPWQPHCSARQDHINPNSRAGGHIEFVRCQLQQRNHTNDSNEPSTHDRHMIIHQIEVAQLRCPKAVWSIRKGIDMWYHPWPMAWCVCSKMVTPRQAISCRASAIPFLYMAISPLCDLGSLKV